MVQKEGRPTHGGTVLGRGGQRTGPRLARHGPDGRFEDRLGRQQAQVGKPEHRAATCFMRRAQQIEQTFLAGRDGEHAQAVAVVASGIGARAHVGQIGQHLLRPTAVGLGSAIRLEKKASAARAGVQAGVGVGHEGHGTATAWLGLDPDAIRRNLELVFAE